jgi:hypothetical protein
VSIYDVGPTILKLLGIEYEPKMPFGADMFSNATGRPPKTEDFQTIYDMFTSEMNWRKNVSCFGGIGTCEKMER